MTDAADVLKEAEQELELAAELVRKAQRQILKRFRDKRKREGRCQDCGVKIEQFSRCRVCRGKRNERRRLRHSA